MTGIPEYAEKITAIYNEHAEANRKAYHEFDMVEESVHAFICNAIALAMSRRPWKGDPHNLRKYFSEHVITD